MKKRLLRELLKQIEETKKAEAEVKPAAKKKGKK